jgi:hypothetical protein
MKFTNRKHHRVHQQQSKEDGSSSAYARRADKDQDGKNQ